MKVSVAALLFLILAVALGSQSRVTDELRKTWLTDHHFHIQGLHRPSECCNSYTSRIIRCTFMEDYFETSTGCSQPGVIFTTKKQQHVCANPRHEHVQDCMRKLRLRQPGTGVRIREFA